MVPRDEVRACHVLGIDICVVQHTPSIYKVGTILMSQIRELIL